MNASSFHYSLYFQSLFLFCITVTLAIPFASSATTFIDQNERDKVALLAFRSKIVQDPHGVLNSWNESRHFCKWEGITCGHKHRRVIVLDLRSKGLSGSLSPYIGNLSFLRELKLSNNSIQGEIPHEFGRLRKLKFLYLHTNSLTGEIPVNLSHCSRLTKLYLGGNKLVGKLWPEFVSLRNLKAFNLLGNNVTGNIPSFLGNFTSLEVLSLSFNAFEGAIPNSLDQLKMLRVLDVVDNNLFGTIPPSLYNLSSLRSLVLSQNQLHGILPHNLGLTLPNLRGFVIAENFFSGSIPTSLSNASKLEAISVAYNNLSGKLSLDFGGMEHLSKVYLNNNKLGSGDVDEMNFVESLANCSNLMDFSIPSNQFRGVLPHSIANLSTKLEGLDVSTNQLYGMIPPGIANLVNLNMLHLGTNQFTGPIPKEFGQLPNLRLLGLYENQLSGEIPSSLGNLSLLDKMILRDNKLSGIVPSSIANLNQLTLLDLSTNDLEGSIPEQVFNMSSLSNSLDVARNHLVGSISPKIGNLKVLTKIDASDNNLSGEIPNEIGSCSNLEYLYLEGNFFHETIPLLLSSLKAIRELDLSRNNLSGQIPKFLETLPLEMLNLSCNTLEGEVPIKGIFKNASAISIFRNSNRLCGGIAQLQLPKCPSKNPKKDKISLVFKYLISATSAVLGLIMILSFIFCWHKRRREEQAYGSTLEKPLLKVSYQMLLKATNGFSPTHLVGKGSFGSVYKGIIDQDGSIIAVKVLNLQHEGACKSFMMECKALKNIRHRNLVRIITSCSSIDFQGNDFKAIIYEFMENGNLENWLHPSLDSKEEHNKIQSLTILQRVSIAIDVASAIEYLHLNCQEPVIHCDIKPSNILLDNDMTAHLGDFGLARMFQEVSYCNQSSTIGVKGTIGYIAPEYGLGKKMSATGDIYSFGILLLEMVTRNKPTDGKFEGDLNLHSYARTALPDRVMNIVDPMLLNEGMTATNHRMGRELNINREECLISMVKIGVACSMESPQDRMNISRVVRELQSARKILLQSTTEFNMQRR